MKTARRTKLAFYRFPVSLPITPMLLFSDLHLFGKANRSISVSPAAVKHFFHLLQRYQQKNYTLYGLGDILEGWRFQGRQILRLHPELSWFIMRHVTIIRGNHDWQLWKKIERLFDKKTHDYLQVGPIFMSHGHEADPLNRRPAWYKKYAAKLAGLIKRVGLDTDQLYRVFRTKKSAFIIRHYHLHAQNIQERLAPTAKIFCFGHVHLPYLDTSDKNLIVVNLGSIANSKQSFSYAEITARGLTLWKIDLAVC